MDSRIKKHLEQYGVSQGWDVTDEDILLEILMEANQYMGVTAYSYYYQDEFRYVVEIGGMIIGYIYAEANRDESMSDLGYEFDDSTVCEMRPIEKTIII